MIDMDILKIQRRRKERREEARNRPCRDIYIYIVQDLYIQREGAMRNVPVSRTRDSHRDDGNDNHGGDGYRHTETDPLMARLE